MNGIIRSTCRWIGFAALCSVCPAVGQDANSGFEHLKRFLDRPLVLGTGSDSVADRFQFEVRCRDRMPDGSVRESRIVAERSGADCAVAILSSSGVPAALHAGGTLCVVDDGFIGVSEGVVFKLLAGVGNKGNFGVSVDTIPGVERSNVLLDLGSALRMFLREDFTIKFNRRFRRYEISSPGGARLSIHLVPAWESRPFPIESVVAHLYGKADIAISNLYVGVVPPRNLLPPWLPMCQLIPGRLVTFDEIKSPVTSLGLEFDDRVPGVRATGLALLQRLPVEAGLSVASQDREVLREVLAGMSSPADAELRSRLSQLRDQLARHLGWDASQISPSSGDSVTWDGDLGKRATRVEIVLGPDLAPALYDALRHILARKDVTSQTRLDALDLLGQLGLPTDSPIIANIEESLKFGGNDELQAALAAFRVRHGRGDENDAVRLHRALEAEDAPPHIVLTAIEGLAWLDEIAAQRERIRTLLRVQRGATLPTTRLLRAVGTTNVGRELILELLAQGDPDVPLPVALRTLGETLKPGDPGWTQLTALARPIALNQKRPKTERILANRLLHRDATVLASDYSEAFFESVSKLDDRDLAFAGMWNLLDVGKTAPCYAAIERRLRGEARARADWSKLLAVVSFYEWTNNKRLDPSFWPVLDLLFKDRDPAIRAIAPNVLLVLRSERAEIPLRYVQPLVDIALSSDDPEHLAVAVVTLIAITGANYMPPVGQELSTSAEVLRWFTENASRVKEHLRGWSKQWNETERRPEGQRGPAGPKKLPIDPRLLPLPLGPLALTHDHPGRRGVTPQTAS